MTSTPPKIDPRESVRRSQPARPTLLCAAGIAGALTCAAVIGSCGGGDSNPPAEKTESKEPATVEGQTNGSAASVAPVAVAPVAAAVARPGEPGGEERAAAFAAEARKRLSVDAPNVPGDDPAWFFLGNELRQIAHGKFWETGWSGDQSGGTKLKGGIDPIPSMVEFHELLRAKGIELIVVPVPAKASIYPDKLAAGFEPGDATPLAPYLAKMKEAGLDVIDLEPIMLEIRAANPGEKLWCEQDAHYSPRACEIIADLLKKKLERKDWFAGLEKENLKRSEPTDLKITGDQIVGSEWAGKIGKETLSVRFAGHGPEGGGNLEPVEPDVNSPILLIGDSHTLVFQEGSSEGMHCEGAGLLDQLAFTLQVIPDHLGVRGSGLMQARRNLLLIKVATNPGYWDDKKVVIWVFSAREFTQSGDQIISIPIER